jgi:hypothetical protein
MAGLVAASSSMHARRELTQACCRLGACTTGMANCFIGVVLAHDLKRMSWPGWLVPMCLLLGSIVLVGLVLEAARIRVSCLLGTCVCHDKQVPRHCFMRKRPPPLCACNLGVAARAPRCWQHLQGRHAPRRRPADV